MRNLLWIGAISVILVGLGCTDEAEQRREETAWWRGPSPDQSLGIAPASAADPGVNKPALPDGAH